MLAGEAQLALDKVPSLFFPANAPVKTEIIPYIIGLNYPPSHLTAASLAPEVRSNLEQ